MPGAHTYQSTIYVSPPPPRQKKKCADVNQTETALASEEREIRTRVKFAPLFANFSVAYTAQISFFLCLSLSAKIRAKSPTVCPFAPFPSLACPSLLLLLLPLLVRFLPAFGAHHT